MPRRGSAILEAGLLLPVLIFMTCGAMDFARVFYAGIVVESAARAGVQHGSFGVGNDDSGKMNDAAVSDSSGQGLTGVTASSRTLLVCRQHDRSELLHFLQRRTSERVCRNDGCLHIQPDRSVSRSAAQYRNQQHCQVSRAMRILS